jgi:hypothetical protein
MPGALFVALAFAGCGAPRVSLDDPKQAAKPADYIDTLKMWTRHGHLMDDFDTALDVDATLHSPEFRAAYTEKWIQVYRVGPSEAARVRGELLKESTENWEFHVETSAHYYHLNDLSTNRSVWRVALFDDNGHEATAKNISSDGGKKREIDLEFYPYANVFSRGWKVRFPRQLADGTPLGGPGTKTLTLRIAGPQGSMDLVWNLK